MESMESHNLLVCWREGRRSIQGCNKDRRSPTEAPHEVHMKMHIATLFTVLLMLSPAVAQDVQAHPGYRLAWSDEFDGNTLSPEK
jgi:hypothetical protein